MNFRFNLNYLLLAVIRLYSVYESPRKTISGKTAWSKLKEMVEEMEEYVKSRMLCQTNEQKFAQLFSAVA